MSLDPGRPPAPRRLRPWIWGWAVGTFVWLGLAALALGPVLNVLAAGGLSLALGLPLVLVGMALPPALGALTLAHLRGTPVAVAHAPAGQGSALEDELEALSKRVHDLDRRLSRMEAGRVQPKRAAAAPPVGPQEGPELPLEPIPSHSPASALSTGDLLMALNFPRDVDDADGFDALERTRADGRWAEVLSAAEDVLNLLSQDGLYLDDLSAHPLPTDAWRTYGLGDRRPLVHALDPTQHAAAVARIAARSREDEVFRDAALHLLRRFEGLLEELSKTLSDEDLDTAMETRSARAFVLLNRAVGALSQTR
ncbi:MAG: hypothetical protein AAFR93_13225 [Pseudomonadota bacterium]